MVHHQMNLRINLINILHQFILGQKYFAIRYTVVMVLLMALMAKCVLQYLDKFMNDLQE